MAAYYALHMIGIKDNRRMYKEKSKEDKTKQPTLLKALQYVSEKNPNFKYTMMSEEDWEKPGNLFNNHGRTKQSSLPENLNKDDLWIIFRILYGCYAMSGGLRTKFVPLDDDSLGYAIYHAGTPF